MIGNPLLAKLPERFRWTPHNVFAHPVSELVYQVALSRENWTGRPSRLMRLGDVLHDWTVPLHDPNEEGRG